MPKKRILQKHIFKPIASFVFTLLILTLVSGFPVLSVSQENESGQSIDVRVGIVWNKDDLKVDTTGKWILKSNDSEESIALPKSFTARAVEAKPVEWHYLVRASLSSIRTKIEEQADKLRAAGYMPEVVTEGFQNPMLDSEISGYQNYIIYLGPYEDKDKADALAAELKKDWVYSRVIPAPKGKPSGKISIKSEGVDLLLSGDVKLIPAGEENTLIVKPQWRNITVSYPVTIRISNEGNLNFICTIPMEEYLIGVLPSEMSTSFPLEALKAQAVAARSTTLRSLGRRHNDEDFDICSTVHCQAFSGSTFVKDTVRRAVAETVGLVLVYKGNLCEIVYHSNSGGITEDVDNIWHGGKTSYLASVIENDSGKLPDDLYPVNTDERAEKWVTSMPDVYSNLGDPPPRYINWAKETFRWTKKYTNDELRGYIKSEMKQDPGRIRKITTIKRGDSGRIIDLLVEGEERNIKISLEYKIRKAFAEKTLNSSCFIVIPEPAGAEFPETFTLKGAGSGHGGGLSQIGAAMMAESGKTFKDILGLYYRGAEIRKAY